jgi:hypothetical protein
VPETVTKELDVVEEIGTAPGFVPEGEPELRVEYWNPLDQGLEEGAPDEREVGTSPG